MYGGFPIYTGSNTGLTYNLDLQLEIKSLKQIIIDKDILINDLTNKLNMLERRLNAAEVGINNVQVNVLSDIMAVMGNNKELHIDDRIEIKHKFEPHFIAGVERLLRVKESMSAKQFEPIQRKVRKYLSKWFKIDDDDWNLYMSMGQHDFLCKVIKSWFEEGGSNADNLIRLTAMALNDRRQFLNAKDLMKATEYKFSSKNLTVLSSIPMDVCPDMKDSSRKENIYKKHYITNEDAALLHTLSHLCSSVKFSDIFTYSVKHKASLCPNGLLSIIDKNGMFIYVRVLRVCGDYVFLLRLYENDGNKVEGLLYDIGTSPITLVRMNYRNKTFKHDRSSDVEDLSISQHVTGLLYRNEIHHLSIGTDENGLFINAAGIRRDQNDYGVGDCCYHAHGKSEYDQNDSKRNRNFKDSTKSTKPSVIMMQGAK